MAIITLSHSAFGGGREVANRAAAILDHQCISREVLIEASRRYGIPEARYYEVLETEPRWWERWIESLRLYRITLQAAMCEAAQEGRLVYHGHGGQELFPGVRHVLKVFLSAPMEYRIEQVKARKGMDELAARQYLKDLDKIRTRRLKALFGVDWRDPGRYDLVLNLSRMTIETAAHLVVETAHRTEYQPDTESEQALQDLMVTARVQATLAVTPSTRHLNVRVESLNGEVRLYGILTESDLEQTVIDLIRSVPGVRSVESNLVSPPIEYIYP
ncbi:MAG: cytidylate kinase family protein [Deltaproteobacteria bacterium]|nr:cytidylate kinase family protein [Deltaproteobacteria bacterium]